MTKMDLSSGQIIIDCPAEPNRKAIFIWNWIYLSSR
jgi:hypothetical protein